ncbi:MAG: Type 1 glutamine amidotransferase-like domain-containing protein [Patescibacteria group bacterium]|nr:Type 1 glutamine amidotransferase-like domain-containing protein [Patescibacteria group bacterium]
MQYFLNGGRDERGVVKNSQALAYYQSLGIQRLLIIPYAIMEDFWQQLWHDKQDLFGVPGIETRALTSLDVDPQIIRDYLEWADFIYLPGGAQKTLLRRMEQLGTAKVLREVIQNGSCKLLGGGSAGAMVMGTQCIVGRSNVETVVPGLNLVPGYIIDSHFANRNRESRLLSVLADHPELSGLGIDEDTGLVLGEDFALQAVYGAGTVSIYTKNKKEIYDSNSRFN